MAEARGAGALRSIRVPVPLDHPAFAGHFPGAPLLPGVVLLSEVLEVLLAQAHSPLPRTAGLRAVKFLAPVRPGAALEIRFETPQPGAPWHFEVWRHAEGDGEAGVLAASGQVQTGHVAP